MIAKSERVVTDMAASQLGVFLPVSELFPDIKSDFTTFECVLKKLSRTDTLFWCARLNLVVSDPEVDHIAKQQFGLDQFLTPEEISRVNDFASEHGGAHRVTVFFRGQLLELIRWALLYCDDHPEDGATFENPDVRRSFAQAALIAGDIWAKRVFGDRFSPDGGIDIARRRSLGAIRKSIEGTLPSPHLPKSLGRGWAFFTNYFPAYNRSFNNDFLASTGLSLEDYFICLGAMITSFMNPKIGTGLFNVTTLGKSTPYADVLQKYIDLESQTIDELRMALWGTSDSFSKDREIPAYDYQPLRQRPILRSDDGRAIILDPTFFSEKASVGPLFLLPQKERQQAIPDFGKAFESCSCDILGRMFPDISKATDKRFCHNIIATDNQGVELEIDACLNDINEIVLFEIKTGLIREDTILSEDYNNLLDQIRQKYVWSEKDKGVGVGQLAKAINILAKKNWIGSNQEFSKVQLVYPVLLVYDHLLGAPVYGNYLASEFKELLFPDNELPSGELVKANLRIAPLIIMTIDDLENLETSIEHFGFRHLLSEYSRVCPDRLTSLYNFIAASDFKDKIYHNKTIAAAGLNILEKVKEKVFPGL